MEVTLRAILLLFLVPLNAYAIFHKIYDGYKNSDHLKAIKINESIIEADFNFGLEKFDWKLSAGVNAQDSFLQSLFSFQSQQTISNTYSLGLKKNTYKYGSFSIEHLQTEYDLSNWSSSVQRSFSDDKVFESKNSLTYTYDFLNKSLSKDWSLLLAQNAFDQVDHSLKIQKDSYDFFSSYLAAKQGIVLDRLFREFEARAKKRVKLVQKRVNDGLSRKYELNQANLSLLTQQETVIKNKSSLREKVLIIEDIVGFTFNESQYRLIRWSFKPIEEIAMMSEKPDYLELERLKKVNEITNLNLEKLGDEIGHSLNLSLGYTKNFVNEDKSESLSKSFGEGKNDEKFISLVYTIPLGADKKNYYKEKLLLQKNKNDLDSINLEGQIRVQLKLLKENIERYSNAISLLKQKEKIANASLKEHQRLYLRGQVSFEELIRADETLINAKISKINMYALYEQALAQYAYKSGKIISFLNSYVD